MERMTCKTCGCESMMPMQVRFSDTESASKEQAPDSRFFTCHVCGDNWLSVKETARDGAFTITFVHQMGTEPILKRVAHLEDEVLSTDDAVTAWDYFLDDEVIDQEVWFDKLSARRKILKSVCTN